MTSTDMNLIDLGENQNPPAKYSFAFEAGETRICCELLSDVMAMLLLLELQAALTTGLLISVKDLTTAVVGVMDAECRNWV